MLIDKNKLNDEKISDEELDRVVKSIAACLQIIMLKGVKKDEICYRLKITDPKEKWILDFTLDK